MCKGKIFRVYLHVHFLVTLAERPSQASFCLRKKPFTGERISWSKVHTFSQTGCLLTKPSRVCSINDFPCWISESKRSRLVIMWVWHFRKRECSYKVFKWTNPISIYFESTLYKILRHRFMWEQEDIISMSTVSPIKLEGFKLTPLYWVQVSFPHLCVPWYMGQSAWLVFKYMESHHFKKCFQRC